MLKVLFLCTGNSCRSQMAEGLVNYLFPRTARAYSAGVDPTGINPRAIKTMEEIGIDISGNTVNFPEDYRDTDFDYIITLCGHAKETCPHFPGWEQAEKLHWGFPDPARLSGEPEEIMDGFRRIRDEIEMKIREFF